MHKINEEQINKKYIITEGKTSISIFIFPIFIFISSIIHLITNSKNNYIVLFICIPFFIFSFLNYFNKKIILTKSTIYLFINKKSTFSVKLSSNFKLFDIKQTKIGKILNYGTIYIVDTNNNFIEYKFFKDPLSFRKKLVKVYEREMKKINPDFQIEETNEQKSVLDKVE